MGKACITRLLFQCCIMMVLVLSNARADDVSAPDPIQPGNRTPAISIIIDDMGNRTDTGQRVIHLPGAVACAFLPHAPFTRELALLAHSANKEILLHAPMESEGRVKLGPGALTLDMSQEQFISTLQKDLEAVPHVRGINNHMGSLLTRHPGHMLWLMQEISRRGHLFFVDSRTTTKTVAGRIAGEMGVPSLQRDIFLDNVRDPAAIEKQFIKLIQVAKRKGTALGIGHAYTSTLTVLERMLPELESHDVHLVSLADLIRLQKENTETWRVSWYR